MSCVNLRVAISVKFAGCPGPGNARGRSGFARGSFGTAAGGPELPDHPDASSTPNVHV